MTDRSGATSPTDPPRDGAWRGAFRLVALVFIAIPLISILTTGADMVSVVLGIGGALMFIAILTLNTQVPGEAGFFGFPAPRPRIRDERILVVATSAAVLALIAIAVVDSLHRPDAGWFAFFYFASTAASTIRNGRVAIGLMVAAGIAAGLTFIAVNGDPGGAIIQGLSVTIIGVTVYSAIAVRRTNRALVEARHELARLAVTDERARIARDLHDTLGHTLSVIALKSELAARLVDEDPARARSEMEDVQRVARESLTSVRETIGGYRRASLAAELAGARSALAAAGIEGRVEPSPEGLPPTADAILGWAVREGVTNILRHGRARSAEIRVETDPAAVMVEISTDRRPDGPADAPGGGTTPAGGAALSPDAPSMETGSGLVGLRERVAAVGGVVEAGGLPDGGFRLRVSVPLG
jgi:two-component system, NarL family, sensor histidine kinase DesK